MSKKVYIVGCLEKNSKLNLDYFKWVTIQVGDIPGDSNEYQNNF